MADSPIKDASLKPIDVPDLPSDEAGIGFTATEGGDVGVTAQVNKDIGNPGGWTWQAWGAWWKDAGWSTGTFFKWRKTPKP